MFIHKPKGSIEDSINSIPREFANNRFLTLFLLMEDHKHGIWGKNYFFLLRYNFLNCNCTPRSSVTLEQFLYYKNVTLSRLRC